MHPIFDSLKYKWSDQNADTLYNILKVRIKKPEEIDRRYQASGDDLPDLNLAQAPSAIWKEALDNLAANSRLKAFCEKLLKDGKPPTLVQVLEAIFKMESVADLKIVDNSPLLDRKNFREKLMALADPESNTRVLIVRGEKQSGKTYGRFLFSKVAKAKGGQPIYLRKGAVNNLKEVLSEIFAPLGGYTIQREKDQNTTDPAWHRKICTDLLTAVLNTKASLWIAMDNLGKEGNTSFIEEEIRDFFNQLVVQMSNDLYRDHIRLMLIDYPQGDTPALWDEIIWQEDRTSQQDVELSHVIEVISAWHKMKEIEFFEDDVREEAEKIITKAEAAVMAAPADKPVSRIKSIDEYLKAHLNTIKK